MTIIKPDIISLDRNGFRFAVATMLRDLERPIHRQHLGIITDNALDQLKRTAEAIGRNGLDKCAECFEAGDCLAGQFIGTVKRLFPGAVVTGDKPAFPVALPADTDRVYPADKRVNAAGMVFDADAGPGNEDGS